MRETRWLMLALVLAFASASFAHGNKVHIRGKVEKIGSDSLQVKTPEGKTVEVKLAASTVYLLHAPSKAPNGSEASSDKPAKLADLAVGDAVVIHAAPKGETLEAEEVKFSAASASKVASTMPKPKS